MLMKNAIYSFFLLALLISLGSCNSTKKTNSDAEVLYSAKKEQRQKAQQEPVNYTSLAHYLRVKGGVQVTGYDDDTMRLKLRGMNSIQNDTRPFIYIDGVPFGRSYKIANQGIDPNDIRSVRVLSSLSETAIYGENGHSGIILIKTNTNSKKKKRTE